jgi:hypothetical protein
MRTIYVIYRTPTDFPRIPFVMRVHRLFKGEVTPTDTIWTALTIEELRRNVPAGCVRFDRSARDEPQIVEWWG